MKTVTVVALKPFGVYNARERFGATPELAAKLQAQGIARIANPKDALAAKKETLRAEAERKRAEEEAKSLIEKKRAEAAEQKRARRARRGPKPKVGGDE